MWNYFPIITTVWRFRIFVYLWNIFCVNAVYWIADVLFCRYNEREGEHACRGDAVVEAEHPAVNVNVRDVKEAAEFPENFQHDFPVSGSVKIKRGIPSLEREI